MSDYKIKLLSGGFFDFVDIEQSEFTIEDIAHNLSRICRYTGAIEKHYSVAEHSVRVSFLVEKENALAAQLHDASEAFMSDINSPLKKLLPDYRKIEEGVEKEIFKRFNLEFPMHPSIKIADMNILQTENYYLRGVRDVDCSAFGKIIPWSHKKAKLAFIHRYKELTGQYEENTIAKWRTEVKLFFMK